MSLFQNQEVMLVCKKTARCRCLFDSIRTHMNEGTIWGRKPRENRGHLASIIEEGKAYLPSMQCLH